jgi:hypothetical protein
MKTFTQRLESLIDEAKTELQMIIYKYGVKCTHSNKNCIQVPKNYQCVLSNNNVLCEINEHMECIDNSGYLYDINSISTSDFLEIVDVIIENHRLNNGDLCSDIDKIRNIDLPITISKSFDNNLDYKFGIDVEDSSYWYFDKKERDCDFEKLKGIVIGFFVD